MEASTPRSFLGAIGFFLTLAVILVCVPREFTVDTTTNLPLGRSIYHWTCPYFHWPLIGDNDVDAKHRRSTGLLSIPLPNSLDPK
jgi:hypothetical protein